jgi:very-short-patch-repair endonuclease
MKIYLAGKFKKEKSLIEGDEREVDWRVNVVDCDPDMLCHRIDEPWSPVQEALHGTHSFSGPFFVSMKNEDASTALSHQDVRHGHRFDRDPDGDPWEPCVVGNADLQDVGAESSIFERCCSAIRGSDMVFAWIDDLSAFGSIWEIGFAFGIGVPIVIGVPVVFPNEMHRELMMALACAEATIESESAYSALTEFLEEDMWSDSRGTVLSRNPVWRYRFCESEIEKKLLDGFICAGFHFTDDGHGSIASDYELDLMQQPTWNRYRFDFAITNHGQSLIVEADGKDYHAGTAEQIAHDKARDRELLTMGIPTIRFTGSDIFKDPIGCAKQARDIAQKFLLKRKEQPTTVKMFPEATACNEGAAQ